MKYPIVLEPYASRNPTMRRSRKANRCSRVIGEFGWAHRLGTTAARFITYTGLYRIEILGPRSPTRIVLCCRLAAAASASAFLKVTPLVRLRLDLHRAGQVPRTRRLHESGPSRAPQYGHSSSLMSSAGHPGPRYHSPSAGGSLVASGGAGIKRSLRWSTSTASLQSCSHHTSRPRTIDRVPLSDRKAGHPLTRSGCSYQAVIWVPSSRRVGASCSNV
mmetsp:Transcript_36607/g.95867  ORF Transcript_36607/g.95867 Transcript_36607/m.95867 type:complete len:218 (+) Transcript_36607:359-1012(+)